MKSLGSRKFTGHMSLLCVCISIQDCTVLDITDSCITPHSEGSVVHGMKGQQGIYLTILNDAVVPPKIISDTMT